MRHQWLKLQARQCVCSWSTTPCVWMGVCWWKNLCRVLSAPTKLLFPTWLKVKSLSWKTRQGCKKMKPSVSCLLSLLADAAFSALLCTLVANSNIGSSRFPAMCLICTMVNLIFMASDLWASRLSARIIRRSPRLFHYAGELGLCNCEVLCFRWQPLPIIKFIYLLKALSFWGGQLEGQNSIAA